MCTLVQVVCRGQRGRSLQSWKTVVDCLAWMLETELKFLSRKYPYNYWPISLAMGP